MKILYCIPSMEGGGTERQVTYLARELIRRGCDLHVALSREGSNFHALRNTGAAIYELAPCCNHDPRIAIRLWRAMAAIRPDICQCWLLQMEVAGGLACESRGVPWVFSERSSAEAYPPTMKNRLRHRMAALADAIVSNSAAGDGYWRAHVGDRVPRYVVPNALPLDEIAAAPAAAPAELQLRPGEPLVLYAGRLDAGKNPQALIQALARIAPGLSVRALLCGEGPMGEVLKRLIVELGLGDRVRISPYTPHLWSLMKVASVLVAPSRFEGSPNVVLEAMAAGCPLVVSDIPAHRELLDDTMALFADVANPDGLAARIAEVVTSPEAARSRAQAGLVRARDYAPQVAAARYLEVYRDVLRRSAGVAGRL